MAQNVNDSIIFLMSARQALEETVKLSENMVDDEIKDSINFIQNEASDLQIMSLLTTGEIIEEKYDSELEEGYFGLYKDFVLENYSDLSESISETALKSMVYDIGAISDFGLSTNRTVMEHMNQTGLNAYLSEVKYSRYVPDDGVKKSLKDRFKRTPKDNSVMGKSGVSRSSKSVIPGKDQFQKGRKRLSFQKKTIANNVNPKAKKGWEAAARSSKKDIVRGAGKMAATAAVIAAAIYGGHKAYKAYLSKAARACKGSDDKAGCMAKYRRDGVKAQISKTQSGMSACSSAKNPEKCKAGIAAKVAKLKSKMA